MTATIVSGQLGIDEALRWIAATAADRDREPLPPFPEEAIARLEAADALTFNARPGTGRPPAIDELELVRAVARADGSVGRIFDGHLNGVERLAVQAPPEIRDRELVAVREGRLRIGVWGADPRPPEGSPATIVRRHGTELLAGVKTFCSGAGGVDRALVLARDPDADAPVAVWVDVTDADAVEVDVQWYRGSGLRASVSHRVVFRDVPVLARLGPPGALAQQPWFSRDALRTAASWVGMADAALESALTDVAQRSRRGALEEVGAGRMLTAHQTMTAWLERAARAMDQPDRELPVIALHARAAIVDACHALLDEAARACGSHPFATGTGLDRSRRDLELFLLQHRLDPGLARAGADALSARRP